MKKGGKGMGWSVAIWIGLLFFLTGASLAGALPLEEVNASRHNLLPPAAPAASTSCALCHTDGVPWKPPSEKAESTEGAPPAPSPAPPLWVSKEARPYSLTAALPREKQPYNQPTGSSLTCLACHDGALGRDMHGINVGSVRLGAEGTLPREAVVGRRGAPPLSRVDHPISIPYPRKADGSFAPENPTVTYARYWAIPDLRPEGFVLPKEGSSAYLDLPAEGKASPETLSALVRTTSGMVQCDSCHNPHSEKTRPFLRVPPSSLCLVCHDR